MKSNTKSLSYRLVQYSGLFKQEIRPKTLCGYTLLMMEGLCLILAGIVFFEIAVGVPLIVTIGSWFMGINWFYDGMFKAFWFSLGYMWLLVLLIVAEEELAEKNSWIRNFLSKIYNNVETVLPPLVLLLEKKCGTIQYEEDNKREV